MNIILSVFTILFLVLVYEKISIIYHRKKIQIRILVTGTRGKSSVTRLIAAGLNANGEPALAKITGSAARIILPDGSEEPVKRPGMASIKEQIKILKRAARDNINTIVIESMSLHPEMINAESQLIIKPNISVFCKTGPDHLDMTANNVDGIIWTFARALPNPCRVFTFDNHQAEIIEQSKRHSQIELNPAETDIPINLDKFSYHEHPENVRLALNVCSYLGIDQQTALEAMYRAAPDPGALKTVKGTINGHPVTFIQAFAANDPQSIAFIYNKFKTLFTNHVVVIINTRNDRPYRTKQMFPLLYDEIKPDECIITGNGHNTVLATQLKKHDISSTLHPNANSIIKYLEKNITQPSTIMGIGNYGGIAEKLTQLHE